MTTMLQETAGISQASVLERLAQRIESKSAQVGIIGLGYVGLPLAVGFAAAGFSVTGMDVDETRVRHVSQGRSYIPDIPNEEVDRLVRAKRLVATTSFEALSSLDAVIICVPTPLRKTREPDVSFIVSAAQEIAKRLQPGQLIVLESTTYPGTTDELILPLLEARGLKAGQDVALAFSPERIDPGNTQHTTRTIPKVIGGVTPRCQRLAVSLYEQVIQRVVPVSSTKVAEMVKLLENTFRAVNIGLVNEVALLCDRLGIDVWEVIEAAKTKPFGFMAFYPGPGIGGHCIPSDPMYLVWKARAHGFEPRLIELADQINRQMPHHVVSKIAEALNTHHKPLRGSRILLLGVAYKKDVNDTRDSPTFEIAQALQERGAQVRYHDPYVVTAQLNGHVSHSTPLSPEEMQSADCVVILTNHSHVDYALVLHHARLIVDTRNQYERTRHQVQHVIAL